MAETTKTTKNIIKSGLFKGEEAITIRLPLTRSEKDDKYVCVNGKSMLIKRGVDVEIPKCIYEVLQHEENMLREAMEFEAKAMGKANADELN